jgi:hypothetical protein
MTKSLDVSELVLERTRVDPATTIPVGQLRYHAVRSRWIGWWTWITKCVNDVDKAHFCNSGVGLACAPNPVFEVHLDRERWEAECFFHCVWYKQVTARAQNKVHILVDWLHGVWLGVLRHGSDKLSCSQRSQRSHNPPRHTFYDDRRTSRLWENHRKEPVVCLLEAYWQFTMICTDVTLVPQLQ